MDYDHHPSFPRSFGASDLSDDYGGEVIPSYCYGSQLRRLLQTGRARSGDLKGFALLDDEPSVAEQQYFLSIHQEKVCKNQHFQNYDDNYSCSTNKFGNHYPHNYDDNNFSSNPHHSNASLMQQQTYHPETMTIVPPHEDSKMESRYHCDEPVLPPLSPVRRCQSSGEHTTGSFLSPRTMSIYERCFAAMEQQEQQQGTVAAMPAAPCLPMTLRFSDDNNNNNDDGHPEQTEEEASVEIEIAPNEFRVVRGTTETLNAIRHGRYQMVQCYGCDVRLQCIDDCEMVVCPNCRTVSPILMFETESDDGDDQSLPPNEFCTEEKKFKIETVNNAPYHNRYGDGSNDADDVGARESHRILTALSMKQQQQQEYYTTSYETIPDTVTLSSTSTSNCTTARNTSAATLRRPSTVAMIRYGVGIGVKMGAC